METRRRESAISFLDPLDNRLQGGPRLIDGLSHGPSLAGSIPAASSARPRKDVSPMKSTATVVDAVT